MDRVPYRRITPSANSKNYNRNQYYSHSRNISNEETITRGETLIIQAIISGILLVIVLLIGILDFSPTIALRGGLQTVLTGATTVDELLTDVQQFGEEWLGWEGQATQNPIIPLPEPANISEEFNTPLTVIDELSNPQIPGPSVVPGLWD